jgi:hypothetical protein
MKHEHKSCFRHVAIHFTENCLKMIDIFEDLYEILIPILEGTSDACRLVHRRHVHFT